MHAAPGFSEALRFWHRLGWISFGGPAGQIAIMHTELVERRGWVTEATFLRALNFCMLLPGPEAMQLATYLGWRLHGVRGGLAAGVLFVLPASVILALLSWLYLVHGELPLVAGALFGVQAAVIGLLAQALWRIGLRVLSTRFAIAVALLSLLALAVLQVAFPLLLLLAAAAGALVQRLAPGWLPTLHPHTSTDAAPSAPHASTSLRRALLLAAALVALWWLPILVVGVLLGSDSTAFAQGLFFSQASLVTFGGAYAVLPYVAQQAVDVHAWLTAEQMLVGLGLAESTPGPLIIVLEFVGFSGGWQRPDLDSVAASALLGAGITLWATFLPSFAFVLPIAPWIEGMRPRPLLDAALASITAAVVGVIANLGLWFGWHLLQPLPPSAVVLALLIAGTVLLGLVRWRWNVAWVIVAAAGCGALLQLADAL